MLTGFVGSRLSNIQISFRPSSHPTPFTVSLHPAATKENHVLLEVDNINTFRGAAHIVRDVSLHVDENEVVALVGRNGAGRTTIIESIVGLLPIRDGNIKFHGGEIGRLPPHKRARYGIGYAPENSGIFPELTVAENLMISRWLSDKTARGASQQFDAQEQALTVFPEVGKFLTRQGLNLSGGRRRWCRSRARWRWRPR